MASKDTVALWGSGFGDDYMLRNIHAGGNRAVFWDDIKERIGPNGRVLEVGCGSGANLSYLDVEYDSWGIDVNRDSVYEAINDTLANAVYGSAYDLPFKKGYFKLVFTSGVLIHQSPENGDLDIAMREIVRCSSDYVLSIEYEQEEFETIPYRGEVDALWKGPYSKLYREMGLTQLHTGQVSKEDGFDDCAWSLFRV